jgi:hypothetical protein
MILGVPKRENSSEKLLRELSVNGLEAGELMDDDKTLDSIVIVKRRASLACSSNRNYVVEADGY